MPEEKKPRTTECDFCQKEWLLMYIRITDWGYLRCVNCAFFHKLETFAESRLNIFGSPDS